MKYRAIVPAAGGPVQVFYGEVMVPPAPPEFRPSRVDFLADIAARRREEGAAIAGAEQIAAARRERWREGAA